MFQVTSDTVPPLWIWVGQLHKILISLTLQHKWAKNTRWTISGKEMLRSMELSQFWWRGEHDNETMTTYGNSGDSVTRSSLSLFSSHKLWTSFSHPCHCLLDNCFHGSRLRSLLCLSKSPPSPPTLAPCHWCHHSIMAQQITTRPASLSLPN